MHCNQAIEFCSTTMQYSRKLSRIWDVCEVKKVSELIQKFIVR
jgi:hypothetical protein